MELAAWFLIQIPWLVAKGVGHVLGNMFSRSKKPLEPVSYQKLVKSAPNYYIQEGEE